MWLGKLVKLLHRKQKKHIADFMSRFNHKTCLINIKCAICVSENFYIFNQVDRYNIPYPTGICLHCGNIQQVQYYSNFDLIKFYQLFYRKIYTKLSPYDSFINSSKSGISSFINNQVSVKDKVLEIGCDTGGNLYDFHREGAICFGLDYDLSRLQIGHNFGINVICGSIEVLNKSSKFNLIILCHVLEHVVNPRDLLISLLDHLKPNGQIYIEVPSMEQILRGSYNYDVKKYFQNAHVVHFTTPSFMNLIKSLDLEIVNFDPFIKCTLRKNSSYNSEKPFEIELDPTYAFNLIASLEKESSRIFRNSSKFALEFLYSKLFYFKSIFTN
jgi:2-polyprenyl-3-methyl-5-hydroxy-6-metoxy-1,4-benzoquinol methylase